MEDKHNFIGKDRLMLFELLVGMHTEGNGDDAVIYQTEKIWNKKHTVVIREYHPIVTSAIDLVAKFPVGKFRRLTETEAALWTKEHPDSKEQAGIVLSGSEEISDAEKTRKQKAELAQIEQEEQEQAVRDAARKGSKEVIADEPNPPAVLPTGKNVTKKFPNAAAVKLSVFMKPGGNYTVFDDESGKILNQTPIKQVEVDSFVEAYLET